MTDEEAKNLIKEMKALLDAASAKMTTLSIGGFDVDVSIDARRVQTLGDRRGYDTFCPSVKISRVIE